MSKDPNSRAGNGEGIDEGVEGNESDGNDASVRAGVGGKEGIDEDEDEMDGRESTLLTADRRDFLPFLPSGWEKQIVALDSGCFVCR